MFDPRPVLKRLDIPVLWLYGGRDQSQPVAKDLTVLRPLERSGKDFKIVMFPKANHQLRLMKPGNCHGTHLASGLQATINDWLQGHAR
jgi:pimeloyl-ACP methyl ester carboxylesterase